MPKKFKKKIIITVISIVALIVILCCAFFAYIIYDLMTSDWFEFENERGAEVSKLLKDKLSNGIPLKASDLFAPQNENTYFALLMPYYRIEELQCGNFTERQLSKLDVFRPDDHIFKMLIFNTEGLIEEVIVSLNDDAPVDYYGRSFCARLDDVYLIPDKYILRKEERDYYRFEIKGSPDD